MPSKSARIDVSDMLTGNLSVGYLRWMIGGRQGEEPKTWTPEFLGALKRAGVTGVEDYITFAALEPERDKPDWRFYRLNHDRVKAAGMRYGVYPWLHFAPPWFVESPDYVPYVCLEHGEPTYSTSIWAPSTLAMYDRFYAQLRRQFGDGVGDIHLGMPADYGEVGFPVGMSSWVVPQKHAHAGFWCGDRFARADFREKMRARYRDIKSLNRAWGTDLSAWDAVDYPPLTPPGDDAAAGARRRWIDFVGWYADSQTEFARKAVAIVRKYYPNTPLQIKMGYGAERPEFGVDNSALVKMCAETGTIVRSTHGNLPAFYYKRFTTPARFYGAALLTEPPAKVDRVAEAKRLFNDITNESVGYFEYTDNILNALDLLKAYRPLMRGERAHTRLALLYPNTDQRLRPGQSNPKTLLEQAAVLRDIADYDLVDENLAHDGALRDYRVLVLFEGNWLEQETLDRIDSWVRGGGTLVLAGFGPIRNVEGESRTYEALTGELAALGADAAYLVRSRFLPAGPVPARTVLDVGGDTDESFLGSGWWFREKQGTGTWRWTQGRATLRVPVEPEKAITVTVVAGQTERLSEPPRLLVNGRDVGELRFVDDRASISVPADRVGARPAAELTIVTKTWSPSKVLPGSKDSRELGLWIERVEVARAGAETAVAQPSPGFRMDLAEMLRGSSRSVGKGRVVRYPLDASDPGYAALIGKILYDDGAPVNPAVDTEFDGVHTAVLSEHIVFINAGDRPVRKQVTLTPAQFAGLPGPTPPARTLTLDLKPYAIQAVKRSDGSLVAPDPAALGPLDDLAWWYPNSDISAFDIRDGILRLRVDGGDAFMSRGGRFDIETAERPILRMQVRTDIKRARLYWSSDVQPALSDAASHGFDLPADGQWHDVRVDLREAAGWKGKLWTLRLDFEAKQGYAEFKDIRLEAPGAR